MDHDLLIQKLSFYSLGDNCLSWFKSYLGHRSNYVAIGTTTSKVESVQCGVPQGSVLGLLPYLLFVNELGQTIKEEHCPNTAHDDQSRLFGNDCSDCCQLIVYADDSMYIVSSSSRFRNQLMLEDKFEKIKNFLNSNLLQINDGKTCVTEFMSCQKRAKSKGIPPELTVRVLEGGKLVDKLITDSPSCRILGINLQNNLGWSSHLLTGKKSILPAIRRRLGALSTLKREISLKGRLQLANSLILSRLNYLLCIWGNTSENFVKKAQIVQNMAGRFVSSQTIQHLSQVQVVQYG